MPTRTVDQLQRASLATTGHAPAEGTMTDRAFVSLFRAYRPHGGLARGDEVAERLHRMRGTGLGSLARRILARELICFEWHGELWLPLLQFDKSDMSLRPAIAQLAAELAGVFDAWELCCWLAAPNSSLDDRAPLDVLENDPGAVLQAARLDRFVARG